jgi:hypothetical protein
MQQAGINWARVDFHYSDDFSQVDRFLAIARKYGISIDFLIGKAPPEHNFGTPEQEAVDSAWLASAVDRYKGDVHVWEVGNEENLDNSWDEVQPDGTKNIGVYVALYIKYLAASYATIKKHDPRAAVVMGGLSEWIAEPWLDVFRAQGGGRYTDAFVVHPYAPNPERVLARLNVIVGKADEDPLLKGKPVWITEVGFQNQPTWQCPGYVGSEENKAAALTQVMRLLRTAGGIRTPIIWYDLHEAGPGSRGFGLFEITSVPNATVTMLPAYAAYKQFNADAP